MRLTKRHVQAAYDCLRKLPPYSRWGLPEKIAIGVNSNRREYGRYLYDRGRHRIEVSRHNVKSLSALMVTMAHELVHLRQQITKTYNRSQHNREFHRLAKHVCKVLGFSDSGFV